METKECGFSGFKMNGFLALFLHLVVLTAVIIFWVYHFCAYLDPFGVSVSDYGLLCLPAIWSWSRTRRVLWCSLVNIKGRSRRPAFSG